MISGRKIRLIACGYDFLVRTLASPLTSFYLGLFYHLCLYVTIAPTV
jgi:hypothetical protein